MEIWIKRDTLMKKPLHFFAQATQLSKQDILRIISDNKGIPFKTIKLMSASEAQ